MFAAWFFAVAGWCALGPITAAAATLRVAIDAEPEGLDPLLHHHASGKMVLQHVGEGLVGYRADLSIAPVAAERIEVSADGRVYRFPLRAGLRFHNGESVTAADIAWNWNHYYLDPARHWECRAYYDGTGTTEERTSGVRVQSVTAVAPDVVEFRLAEPSSLFLHRLADTSCAPLVFHRESPGADGTWPTFIGTGPFRFESWERSRRLRLAKFDDYLPREDRQDGYGGSREAQVDAIDFVVVGDAAGGLAALREDRVDIVPDVPFALYQAARSQPGIVALVSPLTSWYDLLIQTADPLLGDRRIRQAIAHAIDIDYIAAVVTEGRQRGNPSVIALGAQFHTAAHDARQPLDPGRARQLLKEAGYDGRPVTLQTSADAYPWLYPAALIVRDMLRAVGLNVQLEPLSWKEQLDGRYRRGAFQLNLFLFGGRNSPTLAYGKFIGDKAELARFQWDDAAAFGLVQKAEIASDDAALQGIYDELHRRMIEDVPTLPLFNDERFDLLRPGIAGYAPSRFMRAALWGVRLPD
jgi:peptide/nickel transport system substrate-binding protein